MLSNIATFDRSPSIYFSGADEAHNITSLGLRFGLPNPCFLEMWIIIYKTENAIYQKLHLQSLLMCYSAKTIFSLKMLQHGKI